MIQIVLGPVTAEHARHFITHVNDVPSHGLADPGGPVGPEYIAVRFRSHLAPTTTPCAKPFKAPPLQECRHPAVHRHRFSTIRQLQAEALLVGYHLRRRNHGELMWGRTPCQVLDIQQTRRQP